MSYLVQVRQTELNWNMTNRPTPFPDMSFTAWLIAFAASGYFFPGVYTWSWNSWEPKHAILPLVQLMMFGMGVSLAFDDFGRVLKLPKAVLIGMGLQYSVMPLTAWLFSTTLDLDTEVAAGLILVGSCPGGIASNVITYIARANVPLSVTMTACSTVLSPIMTPLCMILIAGKHVSIEYVDTSFLIAKMVLIPMLLGLTANRYANRMAQQTASIFPKVAMFAICIVIAVTVALAREDLTSVGPSMLLAAACHNATGYLIGYGLARLSGLKNIDCRTIALEVGIQNGGMATALAVNVLKSPVIGLGAAVFGPWSAFTGSLLASTWKKTPMPAAARNLQ